MITQEAPSFVKRFSSSNTLSFDQSFFSIISKILSSKSLSLTETLLEEVAPDFHLWFLSFIVVNHNFLHQSCNEVQLGILDDVPSRETHPTQDLT